MFGLLFQDWLKGYDFWGFCDPDIIMGDIGRFVTDDILDKYGRIYKLGHFQLYRNTPEVNSFALHKLPYWGMSYEDIFRTNTPIGLDEAVLTEHLFKEFAEKENCGQYYSNDYADILPNWKHFVRAETFDTGCAVIPAFRWKDGKLFGLSVDGESGNDTEFMYVHLQKRPMRFTPGLENEDSFMIIPNEFVKDHELVPDEAAELMRDDPEYSRRNKHGLLYFVRKFFSFDLRGKYLKLYPYIQLLRGRRLVSRWGTNAKGCRRLYN